MKRLSAVAAVLIGFGGTALAEDATTPPKGSTSLMEVLGDGVQIYACAATDHDYAWVFRSPEAVLLDAQGHQVGSHGAGPTWTLADGSSVIGEKVAEAAREYRRRQSPRDGLRSDPCGRNGAHPLFGRLPVPALIRTA
jgi:hypothetical protein